MSLCNAASVNISVFALCAIQRGTPIQLRNCTSMLDLRSPNFTRSRTNRVDVSCALCWVLILAGSGRLLSSFKLAMQKLLRGLSLGSITATDAVASPLTVRLETQLSKTNPIKSERVVLAKRDRPSIRSISALRSQAIQRVLELSLLQLV